MARPPRKDRLREWRWTVNSKTTGTVRRAARAAAEQVSRMDGNIPVESIVRENAIFQNAEYEDVVAYLAVMGLGYLSSLGEEEE